MLEAGIRDFAECTDWIIYTGTFGTRGQLETKYKIKINIPQYFYKIVLDKNTGKAVSFISYNKGPDKSDINNSGTDNSDTENYELRRQCTRKRSLPDVADKSDKTCDIQQIFDFKNTVFKKVFCCNTNVFLDHIANHHNVYLKKSNDFDKLNDDFLEGIKCNNNDNNNKRN